MKTEAANGTLIGVLLTVLAVCVVLLTARSPVVTRVPGPATTAFVLGVRVAAQRCIDDLHTALVGELDVDGPPDPGTGTWQGRTTRLDCTQSLTDLKHIPLPPVLSHDPRAHHFVDDFACGVRDTDASAVDFMAFWSDKSQPTALAAARDAQVEAARCFSAGSDMGVQILSQIQSHRLPERQPPASPQEQVGAGT